MNRLISKILKNARSKRGSTIVGVLAALVFITLVTSFMVKNTGAQAAASMGYGTAMTMHSTVMSGIMATEAVMANPTKETDVTLAFEHAPASVPGLHDGKKMIPLGSSTSQYFISKLHGITKNTGNEHKQLATVDVRSGTKANGKGLKRALAFIDVGGVSYTQPTEADSELVTTCTPTVTVETTETGEKKSTAIDSSYAVSTTVINNSTSSGTGSDNAVYMAGKLQDGNNGMEVFGGATFEEEVRFQNKKAVFHGDVFFQQDVYFLADAGYEFYGNTYFNSNVTIQNQKNPCQLFKTPAGGTPPDVGVNRTLLAFSVLQMPGNFYTNGTFGGNDSKVTGLDNNKKFYYTSNFGSGYLNSTFLGSNYYSNRNQMPNNSDLLAATIKLSNGTTTVPGLNMKKLEDRRESPLLTYSALKDTIRNRVQRQGGGSSWDIPNASTVTASGGNKLDMTKLNAAFNTANSAKQLYEGHLVVEVTSGLTTHDLNTQTFNNKVIFLVAGGTVASNGSFYCHGTTASTMIYIGPGSSAQLEQLGSNCAFRGYVYIDRENTNPNNGFDWKVGSSFVGAFHNFSTKSFKWNTGSGGTDPLTITYNAEVLAPFFTLKPGALASSNTAGASGSGGGTNQDGSPCEVGKTCTHVTARETVEDKTEGNVQTITEKKTKTVTAVTTTATTVIDTVFTYRTVITTLPSSSVVTEVTTTNCTQEKVPTGEANPGGYNVDDGGITPRSKGYYFW